MILIFFFFSVHRPDQVGGGRQARETEMMKYTAVSGDTVVVDVDKR